MKNLKIDERKAKELYPTASKEFKEILHSTFGEDFFKVSITDRVKTVLDAYEVTGTPYTTQEGLSPDEVAYQHLKVVVKALNEGWEPDWNNKKEAKYYPWFYLNAPSGFRLCDAYWLSATSGVGSRLCFRSRELAEYAAYQFLSLYKSFITGK